jgi:hypothetical protein
MAAVSACMNGQGVLRQCPVGPLTGCRRAARAACVDAGKCSASTCGAVSAGAATAASGVAHPPGHSVGEVAAAVARSGVARQLPRHERAQRVGRGEACGLKPACVTVPWLAANLAAHRGSVLHAVERVPVRQAAHCTGRGCHTAPEVKAPHLPAFLRSYSSAGSPGAPDGSTSAGP